MNGKNMKRYERRQQTAKHNEARIRTMAKRERQGS